MEIQICLISSPEQRSKRAIVLPSVSALALVSASASTNVKVSLKTHFFPSLARPHLHDHPQYTVLITERTSKAYLI